MHKYISISEAGKLLGVCTKTLRRWEKEGKLNSSHRTIGNHRRYELKEILQIINPNKEEAGISVCYARVSSHDQKEDLKRQSEVLQKYAGQNGIKNPEIIEDLGSGLNFKKKGLKKLINLIINRKIDKIFITHKDRLLRFGTDLIINIAKEFNTQVIILNEKIKTFEEELAGDVLEIITVFSARLYGSRSHKNKQAA